MRGSRGEGNVNSGAGERGVLVNAGGPGEGYGECGFSRGGERVGWGGMFKAGGGRRRISDWGWRRAEF
ncbi:unnamed protein product [Staurois parvus]|uniref:Uncharacterized protein n=1 Tax=Staurois parvus TaxID=386267 RepID=A0ABN9A9Z0_9NEOB|nr:unnamed protein product [Staurois parvus]